MSKTCAPAKVMIALVALFHRPRGNLERSPRVGLFEDERERGQTDFVFQFPVAGTMKHERTRLNASWSTL